MNPKFVKYKKIAIFHDRNEPREKEQKCYSASVSDHYWINIARHPAEIYIFTIRPPQRILIGPLEQQKKRFFYSIVFMNNEREIKLQYFILNCFS